MSGDLTMENIERMPRVDRDQTVISINFLPNVDAQLSVIEVPVALDLDQYGEVIGVESINFRHFAGPNVLAGFDFRKAEQSGIRMNYDEETDALTLTLENGRSLRQCSACARVFIDSKGAMVKLDVDRST